MKKRRMRLLWAWISVAVAGVLLTGLGLAVILTGYSLQVVSSRSMAPTAEPGAVLLTDDVAAADVQRGEAYVIDSPWSVEGPVFERVIALGGDRIACRGGALTLNGQPLDEPEERRADSCRLGFDITVQPGRAFLMGDSRGDAADSRYHTTDDHQGTVDLAKIHERVIWHTGGDAPMALPGKLIGAIAMVVLGPVLLVVGKIAALITAASFGRDNRAARKRA